MPFPEAALALVASAQNFALQNGTPTMCQWTAPNDGNLHYASFGGNLTVTSSETGGSVSFYIAGTLADTVFVASLSTNKIAIGGTFLVLPGQTVSIAQSSALTAGASSATVGIWGM